MSLQKLNLLITLNFQHKAITAGVVGGILFFIVAIILSICAVKICNKRKRRKQEKGKSKSFQSLGCEVALDSERCHKTFCRFYDLPNLSCTYFNKFKV